MVVLYVDNDKEFVDPKVFMVSSKHDQDLPDTIQENVKSITPMPSNSSIQEKRKPLGQLENLSETKRPFLDHHSSVRTVPTPLCHEGKSQGHAEHSSINDSD